MQKINQTIFIKAPKKKVWETMLSDATYREWTRAFTEGSYYKGEWKKGSKMLFIGPGENGTGEMGLVSRIAACDPYDYVSTEHVGIYINGVEDTESETARKWTPSFENYTFVDKDGGTELHVEMDVMAEEKQNMEKMWVEGLKKIKLLAEK